MAWGGQKLRSDVTTGWRKGACQRAPGHGRRVAARDRCRPTTRTNTPNQLEHSTLPVKAQRCSGTLRAVALLSQQWAPKAEENADRIARREIRALLREDVIPSFEEFYESQLPVALEKLGLANTTLELEGPPLGRLEDHSL